MSFNDKRYTAELRRQWMIEDGWSEDIATAAAARAARTLRKMYGPGRVYIQADRPDREEIRAAFAAGHGIASLSRIYDLDQKTVRKIIDN